MKFSLIFTFLFLSLFPTVYAQHRNDTLSLYYHTDISTLTADQKKQLDSLVSIFGKDSSAMAVIGYADFRGSRQHNLKLSAARADRAKEYLISRGVSRSRIKISSMGALDAENPEKFPDGIAAHRRTDIVFQIPSEPSADAGKITSIDIDKINTGDKFVWENLNFIGGRHMLLPESVPSAKKLLQLMKDHPKLKIEIQGHICCAPDLEDGYDIDAMNYTLSENRAKAIHDFLIKNGIAPERLAYKGYGRRFPLVQYERSEADRIKNRRVEIKILEK
jgi:outer membrane protein OmpA-like peptidoglycan-associated protein